VKVVTLAYSPDVLLLITSNRQKEHDDHAQMLDRTTADIFDQTDDSPRLAAEVVYLSRTTQAHIRPATLEQVQKYSLSITSPFESVVVNHHRIAEGFEQKAQTATANLVPMRAVAVASLTYPKEYRDSIRSVRHLHLSERIVDGITLKVGDRLTLQNQADARENGRYIVISVDPKTRNPILQSPFVLRDVSPKTRRLEKDKDKEDAVRWRITASKTDWVREGDRMLWVLIPDGERALGTIDRVSDTEMDLVMPSNKSDKASWLHPLARCSSDPGVPTMQMCVKQWDVADPDLVGPSIARAVWDRPCEHDLDCPFYEESSRKHGCGGGGYCAMPLGVRSVGYRGFDRSPVK